MPTNISTISATLGRVELDPDARRPTQIESQISYRSSTIAHVTWQRAQTRTVYLRLRLFMHFSTRLCVYATCIHAQDETPWTDVLYRGDIARFPSFLYPSLVTKHPLFHHLGQGSLARLGRDWELRRGWSCHDALWSIRKVLLLL